MSEERLVKAENEIADLRDAMSSLTSKVDTGFDSITRSIESLSSEFLSYRDSQTALSRPNYGTWAAMAGLVVMVLLYMVTALVWANGSSLEPLERDIKHLSHVIQQTDVVVQREMRLLDEVQKHDIVDLQERMLRIQGLESRVAVLEIK